MGGPPFSRDLMFRVLVLFLLITTIPSSNSLIEAASISTSPFLPPCVFLFRTKPSCLINPPAFLSSALPTYTSSNPVSQHSKNPYLTNHKHQNLLGTQRQSQRAVLRLRASGADSYENEREEEGPHQEHKPSFASRVLATGCYLMPTVDALQAFAPLPCLGRLAGRLAWGCNVASMAASFLVLRKKLLPAPPFVKHHLMTASLLSMCSFTLANIHYKVLSFFLASKTALHESLGFASGASLLSLICRAAVSAARGRSAALPVLSEAVALHLGPDNYSTP